ncbi:MAG: Maf family protein [Pseudomonadota bacterium]
MQSNEPPPLILASASPRRAELLTVLVPAFEIVPADIDERQHTGEHATDYVRRMAESKARTVFTRCAETHPSRVVLGSDTVVVLGQECLGKPVDADQAVDMLQRLSDRAHQVLSAVSTIEPSGRIETRVNATEVDFAPLPQHWIDAYVASGEPMDKAGAYAIQSEASAWIPAIRGSYSGVMGLPLHETAELLRAARLIR